MRVIVSRGMLSCSEDKIRDGSDWHENMFGEQAEYFVGMVARRGNGEMAFISDLEALELYGACVADIALAGRVGLELAKDFFRHWMGVADNEQNIKNIVLVRKSDFKNYAGLVWWDIEEIVEGVKICLSDNFFDDSKWPGVDLT